jgi:hypothetical protein
MIGTDSIAARAALALALALGAGCASQRAREEPPLPFHVAVIPFTADEVRDPGAPAGGEHRGFRLALDPDLVSKAVVAGLDGSCFSRATLIDYPKDVSREAFESLSASERDAYWVRACEAAGADLVLECELAYSPKLHSGHNEKFWMNLPLFLLGGPACYFVDDVSYQGDAHLYGSLFDLNAIRADHATLEDGRAQILRLESRFQDTSLDFMDRAGGNVGLFAASILVPAGLLSHESGSAERKVSAAVSADLARGLARSVRDGAHEILVADRLAGFHLDPRSSVEIRGHLLHFRGEAVLRRNEQERMESYSIRLGSHTASGEFGDAAPDPADTTRRARDLRFPFEADVELDPTARSLEIQLVAAGASPGVRTFTILLPELQGRGTADGTVSSERP